MSITREKKQRKRKVRKGQTISARRNADRVRRERHRRRNVRRERMRKHFKFKRRVVRTYRTYHSQMKEKEAVERTLARYQPRADWHFPLCKSSIRQWHRAVGTHNDWSVLFPKSTCPKTIHYQVPELVVGIVFTLRRLLGWGGHRIAAELKDREIANLSGQTIYNLFDRLGLSVKTYALKGRADGIAYRRYEKKSPNQQWHPPVKRRGWHIDLKHAKLSDGSKVYICIIIDDYSRYALAAVAGTSATTEWVAKVTQTAIHRSGHPKELVSDNGREFVSVWEDSLTKFGKLLLEQDVTHRTCAPFYPQGNGKAEAFIKILNRELLTKYTFETLQALQEALDRYLTFYNNYRLHSAIGWRTPATRYTGRHITIQGLAGIPGIEPMAAAPRYGPSHCDPPIKITPFTAQNAFALTIWQPSTAELTSF